MIRTSQWVCGEEGREVEGLAVKTCGLQYEKEKIEAYSHLSKTPELLLMHYRKRQQGLELEDHWKKTLRPYLDKKRR